MARYRISILARSDIDGVLARSFEGWGLDGAHRYMAILEASMDSAAADPHGILTRPCDELRVGLRSLHLRHAKRHNPETMSVKPVHIIYFEVSDPDSIVILRVLHERMQAGLHIVPER